MKNDLNTLARHGRATALTNLRARRCDEVSSRPVSNLPLLDRLTINALFTAAAARKRREQSL